MPGSAGVVLGKWADSSVTQAVARWAVAQAASSHGLASDRVAVAWSGGADSTALWLAWARWVVMQSPLPVSHGGLGDGPNARTAGIHTLHIDHGLQLASKAFAAHCMAQVGWLQDLSLNATCHVGTVEVVRPVGSSVEAQARLARYEGLAQLAIRHGIDTVLVGHHADDQIETMLLALSRGAGPAGLSGMAQAFHVHGVQFVRPLLAKVTSEDTRHWLRAHGIEWMEDPSNADLDLPRNRFRARLLPALKEAMPALHTTWQRSARLMHQATLQLDAQAQEDLVQVGVPPSIQAIQSLPPQRQANVLRAWLRRAHSTTGTEAQIKALLGVIEACHTRGHRIHIRVGAGHVERLAYGSDLLQYLGKAPQASGKAT
jgi:tRNA(Ile)-lysidine synthase